MNLLDSNLAALEKFQPALAAELRKTDPARNLELLPVVGIIPKVDALIIAGLPTAESWENLLGGAAMNIIVAHTDLGQMRTYLSLMNLVKPIDNGAISFSSGEDGVLQLLNDLFGTLHRRKVTMFGQEGTRDHASALKDMQFFDTLCAANRATLDQFAEEWQANLSENIRDFIRGPFLQDQFGLWAGGSAVVVAAGPSLDAVDGPESFGGAAVVACDTAAPVLAARGVTPDLIVTLDSSEQNQAYLKHLPTEIYERSVLCVTPLIERRVYESFRRVLFYSYGHPTLDFFRDCGLGFEPLASGGSVALTALDIARAMGVANAYLIGFDFQSYRFRTHARGTGAAFRALSGASRFQSIEQALYHYQVDIEARPDDKDLSGAGALTDKKFQKWKEWLEIYIRTNGELRVMQMSGSSARIAGVSPGMPGPDRTTAPLEPKLREPNPNVRRELKFLTKEIEMTESTPPAELVRRVAALARVSKSMSYILAWLADKPPDDAAARLRIILGRFRAGILAALG